MLQWGSRCQGPWVALPGAAHSALHYVSFRGWVVRARAGHLSACRCVPLCGAPSAKPLSPAPFPASAIIIPPCARVSQHMTSGMVGRQGSLSQPLCSVPVQCNASPRLLTCGCGPSPPPRPLAGAGVFLQPVWGPHRVHHEAGRRHEGARPSPAAGGSRRAPRVPPWPQPGLAWHGAARGGRVCARGNGRGRDAAGRKPGLGLRASASASLVGLGSTPQCTLVVGQGRAQHLPAACKATLPCASTSTGALA